ncbi:MAG: EF-hand domain-containing protein [Pseudomonadota bacterium]
MRKSVLIAATAATFTLGTAAFAAFSDADANGDGALSPDEFAAAFPDISAETFASVDTDADGVLSEGEHVAAVEAGVLPAE